jgi:hypothetical protein
MLYGIVTVVFIVIVSVDQVFIFIIRYDICPICRDEYSREVEERFDGLMRFEAAFNRSYTSNGQKMMKTCH